MTEQRIMRNILAVSEKKLLLWLAGRMPVWVTPDRLTWLGLLGAVFTFLAYLLTWVEPSFFGLASLGIILNWFGDSLDGTLARVRHIERPQFGFFFDQTIDLLSTLLIALGLGLSIGARADLCLFALAGYFAIGSSTLIEYALTKQFFVSHSWLGPTELRIMIIIFNTGLQTAPAWMLSVIWSGWTLSDLLVAILGCGLWFYYIIQFVRNYRHMPRI